MGIQRLNIEAEGGKQSQKYMMGIDSQPESRV